MITVVSPRWMLLLVVVTVRVTLHELSITDSPIAVAVSRVMMMRLMYFFIAVSFFGVNNYQQLSSIS